MPTANTSTALVGRERLLQAAAELFVRDGFGPVGLDQIIDAVGVTKTTFYKHFESKDELIVAVLAHQHEVELRGLKEAIAARAPSDPRGQILAIFDVFRDWFSQEQFRGCIFLNAMTEFPHTGDPIYQAALVHGEGVQRTIAELAVAAGATRVVANDLAKQVFMLMAGAIMIARGASGKADAGAAPLARQMAELLISRHMPADR